MTLGTAPPYPSGAVWLEREDDGVVLHLQGEIDTATVARWDAERPALGADCAATFLNSVGVALLVRETDAHRRAGGRPALRNPSRAVLQVLRLTGVADLFDVVMG